MLAKADYSVFGWHAGFDGCGYYRIIKPLEVLQDEDPYQWMTSYDRILPSSWGDFDVIIGQRICNGDGEGNGPADIWVQKVCRDRSILSVYEVDDDLLNVESDNPAYDFFSDAATRQNIKACIASSDLVTVSTEPLREQLLKFNPNVRVLSNYVDEEVLSIPRPKPRKEIVIGWCGSATHAQDFKTIGEELSIVMALNKNTRFVTIGADYSHGLPIDRVQKRPWISAPRKVYRSVSQFDIGIAPLKQNKFNESKSYIKVLEYAALGIPCVASNVGPYRDFVEHGVTGFLASKPGDWKHYISLLANDSDLRNTISAAARNKAVTFTIQENIDEWVNAYTA